MPPNAIRLPTQTELAALPHFAMLAFAARCARRALGDFFTHSKTREFGTFNAGLLTVVLTERIASGCIDDEELPRRREMVKELLPSCRKDYQNKVAEFTFKALCSAFEATQSGKIVGAIKVEETARFTVAAYSAHKYSSLDWDNEGNADQVVNEIKAIWRDFELLRETARDEHWDDKTFVRPSFFGPLGVTEVWEQPKQPNERRAVILTAIRSEFQAVRSHLTKVTMRQHPQGTIYEQGIFTPPTGRPWEVLLVEAAMGNANAALEAERAINFFKPWVALFVGIAGGIKDVKIGDVVAATKLYGYESGKDGSKKDTDKFLARASIGEASYRLQQLAKYLGRNDDRVREWRARVKVLPDGLNPSVFVAPMAAGEKVVASTKSATYKFLQDTYSDALAVEMEGRGFFQTSFTYPDVISMVVRGISDVIDGKAASDAAGYQEVAAATAAAFAMELLANLQDGGE